MKIEKYKDKMTLHLSALRRLMLFLPFACIIVHMSQPLLGSIPYLFRGLNVPPHPKAFCESWHLSVGLCNCHLD